MRNFSALSIFESILHDNCNPKPIAKSIILWNSGMNLLISDSRWIDVKYCSTFHSKIWYFWLHITINSNVVFEVHKGLSLMCFFLKLFTCYAFRLKYWTIFWHPFIFLLTSFFCSCIMCQFLNAWPTKQHIWVNFTCINQSLSK